jgi:hypothetical protein
MQLFERWGSRAGVATNARLQMERGELDVEPRVIA